MKSPKLLLPITMLMAVFLLTACGKDDDSVATAAATTCQAGYGYNSSYGCLPQSYCPVGQGLYQNQCVVASQAAATGDRCSSYYPGTYESTPGWCSCLPNLHPQANGCY
jgi:hypothetical protein